MKLLLELLTMPSHKPRERTYDSMRKGPILPTLPSGVPAKAGHNVIGRMRQKQGQGQNKQPKKRPKKNLWFVNQGLWARDVRNERPRHAFKQDDQGNLYAVDSENEEFTYGVWYDGQNRGVTFHKARPTHTIKHPRMTWKPFKF